MPMVRGSRCDGITSQHFNSAVTILMVRVITTFFRVGDGFVMPWIRRMYVSQCNYSKERKRRDKVTR